MIFLKFIEEVHRAWFESSKKEKKREDAFGFISTAYLIFYGIKFKFRHHRKKKAVGL